MDLWSILEIDPTHDIATIKKAYAKKLKLHHPEEDPEGYQRLREAYDAAIKRAKWHEEQQTDPSETEESLLFPERPVQNQPEIYKLLDEFLEKATALYRDFRFRIDTAQWAELFNSDVMWDLKHKRLVRWRLFRFFQEHRMLPRSVWLLLEDSFHWKAESESEDLEIDLIEEEEFLEYYLRQFEGPDLSFDYLDPDLDIEELDRFLSRREAACWSLQENDLDQAGQSIDEALSIFSEDPDLLRLQGELYGRIGKSDEALKAYAHLSRLLPAELDGYLGRARILHPLGRFSEAILECEKALTLAPDHIELQQVLARSLIGIGDTEKGLAILEQLRVSHPEDPQFTIAIAELQPAMIEDLYNRSPRTRRRLSRFTLSPARQYRLTRRRRSVLFWSMVLVLIANIYYFTVIDLLRSPILVASPEELMQENRLGQYVRMTLKDPHLIPFYEADGYVLDISMMSGADPALLRKNQVIVGYLGDYLVMANPPEPQEDQTPLGESISVVGTVRPWNWLEGHTFSESKLAEQFNAPNVASIFIDASKPSAPRNALSTVLMVLRFPLTIYLVWSAIRRLSRNISR